MTADSWLAAVPPGVILMLAGFALLGLRGTVRNIVLLARLCLCSYGSGSSVRMPVDPSPGSGWN